MVEVKLAKPIVDETQNKTLEVLVVREPTLRDLRMADAAAKKAGDVELGRQLLSQVTGVLPPILDKLSIPDFNAASAALGRLMNVERNDEEAGGSASGGF